MLWGGGLRSRGPVEATSNALELAVRALLSLSCLLSVGLDLTQGADKLAKCWTSEVPLSLCSNTAQETFTSGSLLFGAVQCTSASS